VPICDAVVDGGWGGPCTSCVTPDDGGGCSYTVTVTNMNPRVEITRNGYRARVVRAPMDGCEVGPAEDFPPVIELTRP